MTEDEATPVDLDFAGEAEFTLDDEPEWPSIRSSAEPSRSGKPASLTPDSP